MFSYYLFLKDFEDRGYRKLLESPTYFKYSLHQLPATVIKPESIEKPRDAVKIDVKTTAATPTDIDPVLKFIPNRKYWKSTFSADLKFTSNQTSANWHKGQINNMNVYTNTITTYNYLKNKISLNNTLTTNFTITNAPNDTLRKYTVGTDELRFRSNFGLKAIRNWNYSASGEFITSMGSKYIANTQVKNAAFLSPFTVNVGLGMTYALKPTFKKPNRALDLSLSLEPLAYKYMHSKDLDINLPAHFPQGDNGEFPHTLKTFGSTIALTQSARFNKSVTLYTRLHYFTNYERITGELENKLDVALSKYFSTTVHVFLRYDDGVKKVEGSNTFLQTNTIFSFGFSYKWL